jgi:hypothetical protein
MTSELETCRDFCLGEGAMEFNGIQWRCMERVLAPSSQEALLNFYRRFLHTSPTSFT